MDPSRRPPVPREPLLEDLNLFELEEPFKLDFDRFARNIRSARRGAAGEPSGMTAEHLRPLLENKLCDFASIMVRGEVPDSIEPAVRLGRITALQKPDGGVSCGEQWRGPWLNKCQRRSWRQRHRSSTRQRPNQGASVFRTSCRHSRNPVQDAPSCLWMASALFDLVSRNAMLRGLMSLSQWWALAAVRADVLWPTFRFLVGR